MAKKISASTQNFTEIKEVSGNVLIFKNGHACLVTELTATNFALLSLEEQDAKIYAYAALLNSLSFPIQIVIRSKRLDISSYLSLLDTEIAKNNNPKTAEQMKHYRNFVGELVKVNTVLDKKFYVVIPYEALENPKLTKDFKETAIAALHTKASSLNNQLSRLNLKTKALEGEELVRLFYNIYNEDKEAQAINLGGGR